MIDVVLPNAGKIFIMEQSGNAPLPLLNLGDSPIELPSKR
jgi:hypothetical protein